MCLLPSWWSLTLSTFSWDWVTWASCSSLWRQLLHLGAPLMVIGLIQAVGIKRGFCVTGLVFGCECRPRALTRVGDRSLRFFSWCPYWFSAGFWGYTFGWKLSPSRKRGRLRVRDMGVALWLLQTILWSWASHLTCVCLSDLVKNVAVPSTGRECGNVGKSFYGQFINTIGGSMPPQAQNGWNGQEIINKNPILVWNHL